MRCFIVCLSFLVLLNLSLPRELVAQSTRDHVVSVADLQNHLMAKSAQRSQNIQEIQTLLRHDQVQMHVGNLIDLGQVEVAVATLDDDTLNRLADQSRNLNESFEAGMATWGWVLIALIVAITVIAVVGTIVASDLI